MLMFPMQPLMDLDLQKYNSAPFRLQTLKEQGQSLNL